MTARVYRKAGETLRAEKSRGGLVFLSISEHGVAKEEGRRFVCRPTEETTAVKAPNSDELHELVRRLDSLEVERMTVLSGRAAHHFQAGSIEHQWSETFARLHLSIIDSSARLRVTIDLGGAAMDEIDLAVVDEVADVFRQLTRIESTDGAVLLQPQVAAALWPVLVMEPGALPLEQTTHPKFRRDGDGEEIERVGITSPPWPNRYRPSYRSRPVPMPFHIRPRARGERSGAEIEALGLIEPFHLVRGRIKASLLCRQSGRSFPAQFSLPLEQFIRRIRFVGDQRQWFPYAAGSYGGEVELERLPLRAI